MDRLDNRFLREFLSVAQAGSIRAAADQMNTVPSAISRKIAAAEERLEIKLFERTSRGVALTQAGECLREHALNIQDEQSYVLDQLRRFHSLETHEVRIAVGEGFVDDLMENGLATLKKKQQRLKFHLGYAGTQELQRRVAQGEVDIAIAYNPQMRDSIRSLAVGRQPLYAIVPPDSPLAARGPVGLSEVLEYPICLPNDDHAIRRMVTRAASDQGLVLNPQIETESLNLLIKSVSSGMGVTFLPRCSVTNQEKRREVVAVPLKEASFQRVSAHLMVRARRRLPQSVEVAATFLSGRMQAFNG